MLPTILLCKGCVRNTMSWCSPPKTHLICLLSVCLSCLRSIVSVFPHIYTHAHMLGVYSSMFPLWWQLHSVQWTLPPPTWVQLNTKIWAWTCICTCMDDSFWGGQMGGQTLQCIHGISFVFRACYLLVFSCRNSFFLTYKPWFFFSNWTSNLRKY